jgi:hypothetical protein
MLIVAGLSLTGACASYLDVVPDDMVTLEHAFSTRNTTQRFLMTCYWYLPNFTSVNNTIGLYGGDELYWNTDEVQEHITAGAKLTKGGQNSNDPIFNYWDGAQGVDEKKNLFVAIRDCNIFLENCNIPIDIMEIERKQWAAEVKTLKAYYHFYLMQLYGPIPIVRENLPINASVDEARVYREPVDNVVNYIVELIDEAMPDLMPGHLETRTENAGRMTRAIAAAIKAKALVWAASPLLNGDEYTPPQFSLVDNRGVQLFPQEYKAEKWTRAAEALEEAITLSHSAGHRFHQYQLVSTTIKMSDTTKQKCALRSAITEKFNSEIVWPYTGGTYTLEERTTPNFGTFSNGLICGTYGPTLQSAERFYSKNGIPIAEDYKWRQWAGDNFIQRYEPVTLSATATGINGDATLRSDHKYLVDRSVKDGASDATTAKLNLYREPRFYAWMGFDRGVWELNGTTTDDGSASAYSASPTGIWVIETRYNDGQGTNDLARHMTCGYYAKKLVHLETYKSANIATTQYSYPLIRLSDLYLLYAEALNESKSAPDAEVYQWINLVRTRAGLEGVVESYDKYAVESSRTKPLRKEGMREIIKNERNIELCFEGQRYFDLLRWKDAMQYFNEPIKGWNHNGNSVDKYYVVTSYEDQRVFNTRDYLWPIKIGSLQKNPNLVQNPGW